MAKAHSGTFATQQVARSVFGMSTMDRINGESFTTDICAETFTEGAKALLSGAGGGFLHVEQRDMWPSRCNAEHNEDMRRGSTIACSNHAQEGVFDVSDQCWCSKTQVTIEPYKTYFPGSIICDRTDMLYTISKLANDLLDVSSWKKFKDIRDKNSLCQICRQATKLFGADTTKASDTTKEWR